MQTKKVVITSLFFGLMLTLFAIFPSSPEISSSNLVKTSGTVETIFVSDKEDLVLKLTNDDRMYYVTGGIENGLTAEKLQETLSGKPVDIYYVKQWNLLPPFHSRHSIAKVNINNIDYFSEGGLRSLLK